MYCALSRFRSALIAILLCPALAWLLPVSADGGEANPKQTSADNKPPNIVLLLSDDQAWTDYSFMGHPQIQTPHLDRLARKSAVFRRGYVPTALCRPSLMTLITGRYAHQHGVCGNDPAAVNVARDSPEYNALRAKLIAKIDRFDTLPELLGRRGYLSFQAGKWWEGNYARGGFTHGMTRGFPEPGGRHGDDGLVIGRKGLQPVKDFVDEAVSKNRPFFIWYAPFLPHSPHTPPQRLLTKYQTPDTPGSVAKYYAMCEWYDETCGELIQYLDDKGLHDQTMYVSLTDNGWIQDHQSSRFALRSKQSPNEGGVRTPILLSCPGVIPSGERSALISIIYLYPTLLAAAGIDIPPNLPGLNLLPALKSGRPIEREAIFGEGFAHDVPDVDDPEASLLYRWCIVGKWKLLLTYDGQVSDRLKWVHPRTERRPQLFDLSTDPHEEHNVAGTHPEVVAELVRRIEGWYPVRKRQTMTIFN